MPPRLFSTALGEDMDIAIKDVAMILLGFVLAWVPQWFDRRRKIMAFWAALRADALLCIDRANTYLKDSVMAPLYRMPVSAYESVFPSLLVEGELTEEQILVVARFFSQVQDINRGLDNATSLYHEGDNDRLKKERERLLLKAKDLIGKDDDGGGLSRPLLDLFSAKLTTSQLSR